MTGFPFTLFPFLQSFNYFVFFFPVPPLSSSFFFFFFFCLSLSLYYSFIHSHFISGKAWARKRRSILRLLCGVETVNSLVALLSIDFHVLEQDAKKEMVLRGKMGAASQLKDSNLGKLQRLICHG